MRKQTNAVLIICLTLPICIFSAFTPILTNRLVSKMNYRDRVIIYMSPGFGKTSSSTASSPSSSSSSKSSSNNTSSKAPPKLKPKAQWDRFLEMKKSTPIPVAIRVIRTSSSSKTDGSTTTTSSDWLQVGKIKSEEDTYTVIAVVAQRALIADHATRLYPLQISPKDKVEWAYSSSSSSEDGELVWTLIEKDSIKEVLTTGIERKIGFEGQPDPASGFYCHYVDGRLDYTPLSAYTSKTLPSSPL